MPYLDTSVLTAYYCREARSQRVQRVLSDIEEPAISPLVEVEFHCAVARKVRAGTMDRTTAIRIFAEFKLHLGEPRYETVAIQAADYGLAGEWIARLDTPLRVLDALHLAVAFSNGLPLLTADRELARASQHFGVEYELIS
jgi:predicted nucleic acid-binding protein